MIFGALVGAIVWNIITWWYGIPSSSSHALIGGIVGATVAKAGTGRWWPRVLLKTVAFIFMSPVMGFLLGALMMVAVSWIFRRTSPLRVDNWFRRLQLVSAGLYSLGHGGNDAQKTIGIIWLLLIAAGHHQRQRAHAAGLGDLERAIWPSAWARCSVAGASSRPWASASPSSSRWVASVPRPGGAITLFLATAFGMPVSTTHTITGAIFGVGSVRNASGVRWGLAGNIVMAWVVTIPATAFIAAVCYGLSLLIF